MLGAPDEHDLERLRRGVLIDGRRTAPATVSLVHHGRGKRAGQTLLSITIREGRNRQVRRMCEAIGHPVESLTRVRIGPIRDAKLPAGPLPRSHGRGGAAPEGGRGREPAASAGTRRAGDTRESSR